jgi:hypothetical protein
MQIIIVTLIAIAAQSGAGTEARLEARAESYMRALSALDLDGMWELYSESMRGNFGSREKFTTPFAQGLKTRIFQLSKHRVSVRNNYARAVAEAIMDYPQPLTKVTCITYWSWENDDWYMNHWEVLPRK